MSRPHQLIKLGRRAALTAAEASRAGPCAPSTRGPCAPSVRSPASRVGSVRVCRPASLGQRALSSSSSQPSKPAPAPAPSANSATYSTPVLRGSCDCGAVGFEGHGPSAINFVCHCTVCRASTGLAYTAAAGFKAENVVWLNEDKIEKKTPANSKNQRYYCRSCGGYIGEDAQRPLGVLALPLHRAKGAVADAYRPNHHIFYAYRSSSVAVKDAIPKWKSLPEGEMADPADPTLATDSAVQARVPEHTWEHAGPAAAEGHAAVAHGEWDPNTGWLRKDVLPLSPTRAPESKLYWFTESDPIPNHVSLITPEKVQERVARKYNPSPSQYVAPRKQKRDVVVIGGGHNGLVSAAYLAKQGLDVLVLERRHVLGGAAITEELYPGFKFSRASYLAGLFRPKIIEELGLEQHGFKYITRDPSSFTPTLSSSPFKGKGLFLGSDGALNRQSISQFSEKDADNFERYEEFLGKVRDMVDPLLDNPLPDLSFRAGPGDFLKQLRQIWDIGSRMIKHREAVVPFYELFTAPASHILDRWFESDILKTTLATDAVIGASCSPKHAGSAYVLLHHVMGEAAGRKGVWSYVEGGMGAISSAVAAVARKHGAELVTNATVRGIVYEEGGKAPRVKGVRMADGSVIEADAVLSNATPYHTFLELLPGLARDSGFAAEQSPLPKDFSHHIRFADYSCGALKINCAVDRLPNFENFPTDPSGAPGPQHRGTVHFESRMEEIENAQREAAMGIPATRPVIEMTIPSSLDRTLAPPGKHVVQFFVQFAPYDIDPKVGNWADPRFKNNFADRVFRIVDEFCPGFSSSVLYRDVLSPLDLERVFGLQRGNIMHGALGLHQLAFTRPAFGYFRHRTPLEGLYLCGAGAHPGGGVMGAAGKNCATVVLSDMFWSKPRTMKGLAARK